MPKATDHFEALYGQIDAAALHPDLNPDALKYYSRCADKIKEIKYVIKNSLYIDHDLFLLSNTTHGILAASVGFCAEGFRLTPEAGAYTPYRVLGQGIEGRNCGEALALETHIDPDTGRISSLSRKAGKPLVCDAAQSFATAMRHDAALAADVFVCPLHKHAGLATGLGLLGIRNTLHLPRLRDAAELAEAGTKNYGMLREVAHRANALCGRLTNRFTLTMTQGHARKLWAVGIEVVSPLDEPLPFAILNGVEPARLAEIVHDSVFTFKRLDKSGHIRVSGVVRGAYGDDPLEHSKALIPLLLQAYDSGGKIAR